MDGLQALSHATALGGKPIASIPSTAQHPKAELAALLALLPPDATASDVAVLAVLWAHTDREGEAFPGQKRIADRARVSVRTVRNVVQRLERAGIIARRVPHLSTRPARRTTRYALPKGAGPRPARPLAAGVLEGQSLPPAPPPIVREQQQPSPSPGAEHRQPLPLKHRQPLPPKSSIQQTQSQNARANVLPIAAALADRWEPPASKRIPTPARETAALRATAPNTAPALAVLRSWKAQLSLPLEATGRPLESMKPPTVVPTMGEVPIVDCRGE
jgi:DNA-binding Lrp family transcriptional regulator